MRDSLPRGDPVSLLNEGAAACGLHLQEGASAAFALYLQILREWTPRAGLTSLTDPREIVIRHFLDSLFWLGTTDMPRGARLIDVGTGAGLPGIPVKLVRPDVALTLLESARRKVAFLEHACAALRLEAEVVWGRAEEVAHRPEYREGFDVAVARAVAPLRVLVELCLPFVRVGGRAVFLKGPRGELEAREAGGAAAAVGGGVPSVVVCGVPVAGSVRAIVTVPKVNTSPAQYPRRPGVPARRPL
ncbi:MAG: 16S rRNA (guanine(527)-N(7))-methyltransferase RsmG [Armatimonadetes bacterium]|nr:16S rRNA (guanine(527)-N(7))-methyltransferase RsmG [Armatimonadota bacterium]